MTWAKIDDAILDNPKIIRSGPIGFALHVAAITWCARNLTDGFVPKQKAKQLLQQNWSEASADPDRMTIWELNSGSGQVGRDADETIDAVIGLLVEVGLWAEDFDDRGNFGYQLNDYCEYNPKRADVLAERERIRATRQEAGRRGGQRSAEAKAQAGRKQTASKRQANDQASAPANAEQTSTPVPVPVPREQEPPIVPQGGQTASGDPWGLTPEPKPRVRARGVKALLPEDWHPNDDHRAEAGRVGVNCDDQAERMRDWARAKGERKADWDAAFRNWLRTAADRAGVRPPPVAGRRADGLDDIEVGS